jgi:hypothetical protein
MVMTLHFLSCDVNKLGKDQVTIWAAVILRSLPPGRLTLLAGVSARLRLPGHAIQSPSRTLSLVLTSATDRVVQTWRRWSWSRTRVAQKLPDTCLMGFAQKYCNPICGHRVAFLPPQRVSVLVRPILCQIFGLDHHMVQRKAVAPVVLAISSFLLLHP